MKTPLTNKEQGVKVARIGGYTAVATTIAMVTPGLNKLPIELGSTIVAVVLRAVEAFFQRKFKFDLFG